MFLDDMEEKATINRSIFKEKELMTGKSSNIEKMAMPTSNSSSMMAPPS
jgi:hypothetical protein